MLFPSTRPVLQMPLHDPQATRTGAALGAMVGGAFSLAFQGIGNASMLGMGTLFGAVLGAGFTEFQQFTEDRELQRHVHPHARELIEYPAVRELLHKAGTDIHDATAVRTLAERFDVDIQRMVGVFDAYCNARSITPNPLIESVIRHFFLTHCADRGIALLTRQRAHDCYLVAAHTRDQGRIAAAMNAERVGAGTALRQHRFPYLRVDLANERLRNARSFKADTHQGEWQVHPAEPQAGDALDWLEVGSTIDVTHRRSTRRRCPPAEHTARGAGITLPPRPAPVALERGPALRAKLRGLPSDSRTLRELHKIEGDLAAHRPSGHLVCYEGVHYLAVDIHWPAPKGEGRRSAGRNVWRLLVLPAAGGYRLVDIVNYH